MAIEVPRGAVLPDFSDGWGQLVFAGAGVGRVRTERAHWVLPTARALWLPPGVAHELHCVSDLSMRTLYFAPQQLPPLPGQPVVVGVTELLRALILEVARRAPLGGGADRDERLLTVLHDELAAASLQPLALPMPVDAASRRLAERILADPGSACSLTELCEGCGASRRSLERRFRTETGTPLGAWRRQARLLRAMLGLGEGRSVAWVAAAAGYRTPSAFVQAFRVAFGQTPAQWRSESTD